MTWREYLIDWPVFRKELLVQAGKQRTYFFRVGYAVLMFLVAMGFLLPMLASRGTGARALAVIQGMGKEILHLLVALQFLGLYTLGPALTCGVLAAEKEQQTVELLFMTRLPRWRIILEKYFARLALIFCYLLISLPLGVYAYNLGGIDPDDIVLSLVFLLLAAMQICALGTLCSAYCQTPTQAFLATYLFLFACHLLPVLVLHNPETTAAAWHNFNQYWLTIPLAPANALKLAHQWIYWLLNPAGIFAWVMVQDLTQVTHPELIFLIWLLTLPSFMSIILSLIASHVLFLKLALRPRRKHALNLLRLIDRCVGMKTAKAQTERNIDDSQLPVDNPIAWRELNRSALGAGRYFFRTILLIEVPLILFLFWSVPRFTNDGYVSYSMIYFICWLTISLLLTVVAANLISYERNRQTWEIVLSTPISSQEIIHQKYAVVSRLIQLGQVVLLTISVFLIYYVLLYPDTFSNPRDEPDTWWEFLLTSLSMIALYPHLAGWLAVWMGLRARSTSWATLAAVGAILGWCLLPYLFLGGIVGAMFLQMAPGASGWGFLMVFQASPVTLLAVNQAHAVRSLFWIPLVPTLLNALLFGLCLRYIRNKTLEHADYYIGRTSTY